MNGNLKLSGKDVDAIGIKNDCKAEQKIIYENKKNINEDDAWNVMKTCFDPEIPVNIVDLGLIYDLKLYEVDSGIDIKVKMTLTAPGCGMGPVIADDVIKSKLSSLPKVLNVQVDLVWEPAWNQSMMTDAAKLELGML